MTGIALATPSEESMLLVLRDMIPWSVKVVILAGRGFGTPAFALNCD